ncbi:MAG: hypothetical protein C4550_06540 [Nitrospiraceae bacterium]|nr:MAG: hypothetical protein C4550_06540 [Nitrospiraceae bacterium]
MKKLILAALFVSLATILFVENTVLNAAEDVLYGGDIVYTKPVKSVIFSHKAHVEGKKLDCDACHSGLFDPKALKAQEKSDFNMDSLYKGKYCGACHNGKTAFASNTQCARCHIGVKGYAASKQKTVSTASVPAGPKQPITIGSGDSAVKFSHASHEKSFGCDECHANVFPMKSGKTKVTMEAIYQGQYCGACHNGKKAFASSECLKCHAKVPAPKTPLIYKPKGAAPVNFSHDFHASAFKCDDCHKKLFVMQKGGSKMKMDAMYEGKSCGKCHDGKTASSVSDCGKCHK